MKRFFKSGLFVAFIVGFHQCALGGVINDGTTTNNLLKISNTSSNSASTASTSLTVDSSGLFLAAAQSGGADFFAVRSSWYASDTIATNGVYTVSADFQPAVQS